MKKTLLPIFVSILLAFSLAACGNSKPNDSSSKSAASQTNPQEQKEIYIPIISKGAQHQFWQAVKLGAEKAAKDLNVKISFYGPENETMVDSQISMLQSELDKNPSAICLAALDSKAVAPLLEKANSSKIPVIAFDSGVESNIPLTTCQTNNLSAAAAAADKMAELVNNEGEVALIVHSEKSTTGIQRRDGFVNRIKEKYPNIKVVDIKCGDGDILKSVALAKELIKQHPKIKGIFAANEGSILGTVNAITELNMSSLAIIGFDSGKQQKEAIRSGKMSGSITQDPVSMGYKTVEAAVKAIKGEKLDKIIDTGFKWYNKTNMDSDEIKPLMYD
jgi:ribose transport system substrate-binding protein